jgi:predicted RNA binding protein YcfA (HicA-like mRNA interferase family)
MKLPRDLSGSALIKHLCKNWDYRIVHQVVSHVILPTDVPAHQRLPVPEHPALRVGTLNSILRPILKRTWTHECRSSGRDTRPACPFFRERTSEPLVPTLRGKVHIPFGVGIRLVANHKGVSKEEILGGL